MGSAPAATKRGEVAPPEGGLWRRVATMAVATTANPYGLLEIDSVHIYEGTLRTIARRAALHA